MREGEDMLILILLEGTGTENPFLYLELQIRTITHTKLPSNLLDVVKERFGNEEIHNIKITIIMSFISFTHESTKISSHSKHAVC